MVAIDPVVIAPYALIDYVWALLKANTSMTEAHYNGRIPVIPSAQQPEFNDLDKPYVVYAWSENPAGNVHSHRSGTLTLIAFGTSDREISHITNLISTAFGRYDDSAEDVNRWKSTGSKPYAPITFTSFWLTNVDGPMPQRTEGGRSSAIVVLRYRYLAEYTVTLP